MKIDRGDQEQGGGLMLSGKIEFEGKTMSDVKSAIEEALLRINNGNTSGFDSNDDGRFSFVIAEIAHEFLTGESKSEDVYLFAKETRERIRADVIAEVVAALREGEGPPWSGKRHAADFIEREFGGAPDA